MVVTGANSTFEVNPSDLGSRYGCLNTVSGYLVEFDVYQCKSLNTPSVYEELFGKSSAPLVKLLDGLPEDKEKYSYRIYFDNLFTNVHLMKYLRDISYCGIGTIREDRLRKNCPLLGKSETRPQPRGYFESVTCKEDGILVCKWVDNGVVSIASNCHGIEPIVKAKRYSQAEKKHKVVERPAVFSEYNKCMGGVGKMDENLNRYHISVRSKKWYWPILTWLVVTSASTMHGRFVGLVEITNLSLNSRGN